MKRLLVALRMSLAFAGVALVVVTLAQMLGIIPDVRESKRLAHSSMCASIAMHCALAIEHDDIKAVRTISEIVTERTDEIDGITVIRQDGNVIVATGSPPKSSPSEMLTARVPIILGGMNWGELHVNFRGRSSPAHAWIPGPPAARFAIYFVGLSWILFFFYSLILAKIVVGSTSAIPRRVRETLDTFVEGVLVLNREEKIAYANSAFVEIAGASDTLEGSNANDLRWKSSDASCEEVAWRTVIRDGGRHQANLRLARDHNEERTLAVHAAPIEDESGHIHGALATFDDLTTTEQMNQRLRALNAQLRESREKIREKNLQLKELATTDPLTQCLNRRAFFEQATRIWHEVQRYGYAFSCLILDVDHFKSVNDRYGHAKGDEVLREVARSLKYECRDSDLVCRYGGEEFCVLLPHTDIHESWNVGERCRRAIENLKFDSLCITASVGASASSLGASSLEAMLEQADQSLYQAKETGRNRTVLFAHSSEQDRAIASAPT